MNNRAFFIVGPESSGTRFVNRLFLTAGCHKKYRWQFPEDDGKHSFDHRTDIAFHRSLPHSYMWPDLPFLRLSMENSGFDVVPILVVRDWRVTILSQIRRGMVKDADLAEKNIRRAIQTITNDLPDFLLVSYETICLQPEFRRWLFVEKFGLNKPTEEIHFGNEKYYEKVEQ